MPFAILLFIDIVQRSSIFGSFPINALFLLPLLYYWMMVKPDKISPFILFTIGVVDDSLSGSFLGHMSMTLLILYAFLLVQQQPIKTLSFKSLWRLFCLFMILEAFLEWGLARFLMEQQISFFLLFGQNILSVLFYPWFNRIVVKLERRSEEVS